MMMCNRVCVRRGVGSKGGEGLYMYIRKRLVGGALLPVIRNPFPKYIFIDFFFSLHCILWRWVKGGGGVACRQIQVNHSL